MSYDKEKDVFQQACLQVYTGNGKGKTTAAIGLSVRALGAGLKVFFGQFVKCGEYSEITVLARLENLILRQYGREGFIMGKPSASDIEAAARGVHDAMDALAGGEFGLVVLDEVNVAHALGMISLPQLLAIAGARGDHTELVMTGRGAPPELIEIADLVTEMREVKHYFHAGLKARKGIES
ncbi:MAG: cob(I)yrinic acid a,c-diamide adenosyltransferase [Synergistaceae bacterium]|nr:cob(I)yrinic acid a,c-diamide adenosyltransferase [Synergistaceae bacterium]